MNKKQLLGIAIGLLATLSAIVYVNIKKSGLSVQVKEGKSVSVSSISAKASDLEARGEFLAAKDAYQRLVNEFPNSAQIGNWEKKIEDLNIKLLFSPILIPKSTFYEIKAGDNLIKIAKEFKTTPELIKRSNNLSDDKIMPGRKIKIWNAPFSIVVDKSQNTLMLKSEEDIIKTYIVSTGANNSTPVGNFKIINKLLNPTWFKAGAVVPPSSPENVLGSRWLGIDVPGYGIHGTIEPQSLGRQVTQGCVRMSNFEVEELYDIVPVGAEVIIID